MVDKRIGGNSAKLSKIQLEVLSHRLRQYTPQNLFGSEASEYWGVTALSQAIQKWYAVEYRSPLSYLRIFEACGFIYQKVEKVYKPRSEIKVLECGEQTVLAHQHRHPAGRHCEHGRDERALALDNYTSVDDVEFTSVWGQGHTMAECTGDSTTNCIAWITDVIKG